MKTGEARPRTEVLTDLRLETLLFIYRAGERRGTLLDRRQAQSIMDLTGGYYERSKHTNVGRWYRLTPKGREMVEWLLALDGQR